MTPDGLAVAPRQSMGKANNVLDPTCGTLGRI
jgi:hypothetical protein